MGAPDAIAAGLALGVAVIAAVNDWLRGVIPNWLTMPAIAGAPVAYALGFGASAGLHSIGAGLLSGLIPYLLFRRGSMGGGDVKLFAALGAIMGFDLVVGLEIQLTAMILALFSAGLTLIWKGALVRTSCNALAVAFSPVLPRRWRRSRCEALLVPIRLGGAVLVATAFVAIPHLLPAWRLF